MLRALLSALERDATCTFSGYHLAMTAGTDQVSALDEMAGQVRSRAWQSRARSGGRQTATPALPVVAAVAARRGLLLVGAAVGAMLGVLLAGGAGFTATATLQLTNAGSDSVRVKQVAQTVQRLATSSQVLAAAAKVAGVTPDDLGGRVTALWQEDTDLVLVSAKAKDARTAVQDANALAQAAVRSNQERVQSRLRLLRLDANRLLTSQTLTDNEAEAARRSQIGSALASRQDLVSADIDGITVADPAVSAAPAGLNRTTGGLAGLLGGILLAGLGAVVLGARSLRVGNAKQVQALLPGVAVTSPDQAAEVAGHVVESATSCLAVVHLPGAQQAALPFAIDVADYIKGHGRTVTVMDTASLPTREARRDILRHDLRTQVRETFGTDVLVVVVGSEEDACGMLVGQSNLHAVLVARRRRTPFPALLRALSALDKAEPVVVLAR